MKPAVRAAFLPFTTPLEGCCAFMYLDVKGLVSTGIGNLIDPLSMALPLPWVHADGTPAKPNEVTVEWLGVKGRADLAPRGGMIFQGLTKLRLTREGLERLVMGKLDQDDATLARRFPDFESWPADAQLATLSMAWGCGPWFRFPKLEAALRAHDWATAASECTINPQIGTIVTRNAKNRAMYLAAASTDDPDSISPGIVSDPSADTAPDLGSTHLDEDDDDPPPQAA